jgi:uncharacterized metal-binding protein
LPGTKVSSIVSDMPSGKVHLRVELFLLGAWGALAAYLVQKERISWPVAAAFGASYLASMLLLSPDLDLATSRPFKRWGPLRVLWWPYAAVFRHRRLSHHWFFGPLTRVGYVLAWVIAVMLAVAWIARRDPGLRLPSGAMLAAISLGLYVPNATHIAADAIWSLCKRRR